MPARSGWVGGWWTTPITGSCPASGAGSATCPRRALSSRISTSGATWRSGWPVRIGTAHGSASCWSWSACPAWPARYPHQLSGGQQQRVALARALAPGPDIVLLDEPFSSLDASLRASVRADVHDVLRLSGATSILVTHDQDEALSMADQVAILRGGVIAQINTPSSLYRLPRDAELAQFLGEANLVEGVAGGTLVQTALGQLEMAPRPAADTAISVDTATATATDAAAVGTAGRGRGNGRPADGRVTVMVRPEQLILDEAGARGVPSVVRSYEYFGHDAVVRVQPEIGGLTELVVRITGAEPLVPGTRVSVSVHGAVMVWPLDDQRPLSAPREPERERITHA